MTEKEIRNLYHREKEQVENWRKFLAVYREMAEVYGIHGFPREVDGYREITSNGVVIFLDENGEAISDAITMTEEEFLRDRLEQLKK